jgi:hypothetical protein
VKRELVEKVANAVLYEGYMLYPYTASSLKNQQRFNFGVLVPEGTGASEMRTECLVVAGQECELEVRVRFLWYAAADEPEERAIDLSGWHAVTTLQLENSGVAVVDTATEPLGGGLRRVTVRIRNVTQWQSEDTTRGSMLSTHTILCLRGGEFVSLMDPPENYRKAALDCHNEGTWPVLVGAEPERHTMLSSPIILYDYPQIAPESPGDLFDGLEIDEILTLRVLTLSDEEKNEIRGGGARVREILERTENMPPEQLRKLHGAVRGMRRLTPTVHQGDRVRLCPNPGADIMDIALAGKLATVESVEQDYDGRLHVAVVLEDDPGRELGLMRQPGHRFFFTPEEMEVVK